MRVAGLRRVGFPTVNERITSEFAADTEDDGTAIFPSPEPVGLRRPSLPYAAPRMVAHPRLIPRADLVDRKRTQAAHLRAERERPTTQLERPRRRLARSSSPDLRADNEFDFAVGSAPSPMPQPPAPMFLPTRRGAPPPPLRHRPAPPPLRRVTQVEDEFAAFDDDNIITVRVR